MKKLVLFSLVLLLASCNGKKEVSQVATPTKQVEVVKETESVVETKALTEEEMRANELEALQVFFDDMDNGVGNSEKAEKGFLAILYGEEDIYNVINNYEKTPLLEFVENLLSEYSGYSVSIENEEGRDGEMLRAIAEVYYNGAKYLEIEEDRDTARMFYELSADRSNPMSLVIVGTMYLEDKEYDKAFEYYIKANDIKSDEVTLERLGYCYANGIGTKEDKDLAYEYYAMSEVKGYFPALKGIYELGVLSEQEKIYAEKIIGNDYRHYHEFDNPYIEKNKEIINDFIDLLKYRWDNKEDAVVVLSKNNIDSNGYFSEEFIDKLMSVQYSNTYREFVEEYELDNEDYDKAELNKEVDRFKVNDLTDYFEDYLASKIQLYYTEGQKNFDYYDFDNDGVKEIGARSDGGHGGANGVDNYYIYKKNSNGEFQLFANGPDASYLENMYTIVFDGKVYFVYNEYDITGKENGNLCAYVIDDKGEGHYLYIAPAHREIQKVYDYAFEKNNKVLEVVEGQVQGAINATKDNKIFSTKEAEFIKFEATYIDSENQKPNIEDMAISADIDNDGTDEIIREVRLYNDKDRYQESYNYILYEDIKEFESSDKTYEVSMYFYGNESTGYFNEKLDINQNIVQVWTNEINGETYTTVLINIEHAYIATTYKLKESGDVLVGSSVYLDEEEALDNSMN